MIRFLLLAAGSLLLSGCIVRERRTITPGVNPVTQSEVTSMTKAGYADSAILLRIHADGVQARPQVTDVVAMKEAGVSDSVINAMLEAPVTQFRPPVEERTVYVRDYSPGFFFGAAAITGAILGHHYSHGYGHGHYRHSYHHRSHSHHR